MTANLDSGRFKIVSLTEGKPCLGVNHTKPAWQNVYVNAPVQDWMLRKVGPDKYLLSIGGYAYTGVLDDKVIASIHPEHEVEWEVIRQEYQDAYTIALAKERHLGWTVPRNLADGHEIAISPIISTHSIPPQFLPNQLFRIQRVDE